MDEREIWRTKWALSTIVFILAMIRFALFDFVSERMDYVFLALVAVATLIPLIPWERVKTVKAGGFELTLEEAQVKGAIEGIDFRTIDDFDQVGIQELLLDLAEDIINSKGSRVLWIDDNSHRIIGERRLLRALGIVVITAKSSVMAREILDTDNDFDLIISDIQRFPPVTTPGPAPYPHEGVNFVLELRQSQDSIIRGMPIVFYAAYPWKVLRGITMLARDIPATTRLSNSIDGLLTEVFRILADVRSSPIQVEWYKKPTGLEEVAED